MEKSEQFTTTTIVTYHHFYCDECGNYLGKVSEYDDGWYPEIGELEIKFHLPQGWYKIEKHFCDKCRSKFLSMLETTLVDIGFERECY